MKLLISAASSLLFFSLACVSYGQTGEDPYIETIKYSNGDIYVGEVRENILNGQGTYTYFNGAKYVGGFVNGKRQGLGTFTFANGRVRDGLWENDEYKRAIERQEPRRQGDEDQRQRQQEVSEVAAANATRNEFELVQSATALIQQAVQQGWNRPPSARNGMRAVLQIRMLPTGELVEVRITDSSGDTAFDRSARNAVYSVTPFTGLQSLPINIFNGNFRTLSLIFQPEDLLN